MLDLQLDDVGQAHGLLTAATVQDHAAGGADVVDDGEGVLVEWMSRNVVSRIELELGDIELVDEVHRATHHRERGTTARATTTCGRKLQGRATTLGATQVAGEPLRSNALGCRRWFFSRHSPLTQARIVNNSSHTMEGGCTRSECPVDLSAALCPSPADFATVVSVCRSVAPRVTLRRRCILPDS